MASLAGKADPTIVAMAYRAGMANVPHDYSKYYQAYADQYKELLGDIETSFKTYQLNKEIGLKELDNAMAVFNEPLNAQIIDSEYGKMQNEIQTQRKSYPGTKDPKALQDWNRKNSQIIGRYEQSRTALVDFKKLYDGGVLDLEGMNEEDVIFYTDVSKYQANTNLESGKYNDQADVFMQNNPDATPGELMEHLGVGKNIVVKYNDPKTGEYTYVSQTGEETSIEDKAPTTTNPVYVAKKASELTNVSRKADDAVVEVGDEFQNTIIRAKNTELPYDGFKQQDKNRLEKIAKTAITRNDNSFSYLTRQKFGGQEKTFEEALRSAKDDIGLTAEIITTLGATESDGDNILEITDFATEKSYNTVVNGILGGLDKDLSISLWAEYTTETAYRTGHDQYKKEKKVVPTPGAPPGPPVASIFKDDVRMGEARAQYGNTQMSVVPARAQQYLEDLKSGTSFPFQNHTYDYVDGDWYRDYKDVDAKEIGEGIKIGTADDMEFNVFKTGLPQFRNLKTEKPGPSVDPESGAIITPDKPTTTSTAEDFMKEEETFMEDIQAKYDFSKYIIQERQFELLPGEVWGSQIRIIDRNDPSKYWDFRTNYSKANNAQNAASEWDKWIEDQGIELKGSGELD